MADHNQAIQLNLNLSLFQKKTQIMVQDRMLKLDKENLKELNSQLLNNYNQENQFLSLIHI